MMAAVADPTQPIDISAVLTWPQALVACVIIFGVLVWPGVVAHLNQRATRDIQSKLTKGTDGSSLKDALDRIEATQAEQADQLNSQCERLERIEEAGRAGS